MHHAFSGEVQFPHTQMMVVVAFGRNLRIFFKLYNFCVIKHSVFLTKKEIIGAIEHATFFLASLGQATQSE
jgi:hypothetical protein